MLHRRLQVLATLLFTVGGGVSAAYAQTTQYVATCGDDAWTALSQECEAPDGPKATIQAAINAASNGDRIVVLPGVYNQKEIHVNKEVSIEGDPCLQAVIDGDVAGDTSGTAFRVEQDCTFLGLIIRNAEFGIKERGTPGHTWNVQNCVIENMVSVGLYIDQYAASVGWGNWNNVVARNCHIGFHTNNAEGYLAENCAAVDCAVGFGRSFSGGQADYCGVWNCDVQFSPPDVEGMGCVREDPLFVGGEPFDYCLLPGSAYIDMGNPDQQDCDGSRIDIGAYGGEVCCCVAIEACCLSSGECVEVIPEVCIENLGGSPQGPGTGCTDPQTCCLPDHSCVYLDPLCCADQDGVPLPGETCAAAEACCFADGTCSEIDPLCCTQDGGIPQGANSVCLGDGNANGIDDACEEPETVPTVSQWGLFIIAVSLLGGLMLKFGGRRPVPS